MFYLGRSWSILVFISFSQTISGNLKQSHLFSDDLKLSWGIPGILGYLVLLRYLGPTRSSCSILVYFGLFRSNLVYFSLSLAITAYFSLSRPISVYFNFLFYLVLSCFCHTRLHLGFSANLRIWQVWHYSYETTHPPPATHPQPIFF